MTFTRKSAPLTPIEDNVFAIVRMAKKDIAENGPENVVNATIGSLYDEEGKLVALNSVFDHYDQIDKRTKAAYASGITGNESYRAQVANWVLEDKVNLPHSVIATPGGTGAISTTFFNILEQGQTVILPDIAWENYKLMAEQQNLDTAFYSMFDGDHFNMSSLKETVLKVKETQDTLLIVINDPCHNPTGYSMSRAEWKELIAFLNEVSKDTAVCLLDDIAYIDYSAELETARNYMEEFNNITDNIMVIVAFSCSKTLTSYGMRCGAAILLAKQPELVRNAEIVYEKTARSMWSNIPNAAMESFTWVTTENKEEYMKEKQYYVDLLKQRADIFTSEAKEAGLVTYPYRGGFFITIQIPDNDFRDRYHTLMIDNHIYTVCVDKGIRVGLCSLPVEKAKGLAARMKDLMDQVGKEA